MAPATCRRPPTGSSGVVTLTVVQGEGQFGPPSEFLIDSLTVAVRTEDGDLPVEGILVDWEVASGPTGALLTPRTSQSDSVGLSRVRVQLGGDLGKYVIRASVRDRAETFVDFEAWAVLPPTLSALSSSTATAGGDLTLTGTNFSTIAAHNVVLFSGIAGQVISGDATRLDVMVPPCLPTRPVEVTVQLGGEASSSLPLDVTGSGAALDLAVGADTVLALQDAPGCLKVGSGGPQEYLAVAQSTATIGAGRFDYTLTGLRPEALAPVASRPPHRAARRRGGERYLNTAQAEWELVLREREDLSRQRASGGPGVTGVPEAPGPARTGPRSVPEVGDAREFEVLRIDGGFDEVGARVSLVTERAILYVDTTTSGSLSQDDVELFGGLFDDLIYPVTTGAFGSASDLDANGRVIILFTPAVNRLSPLGASDFVGGFFFGLDLTPAAEHSNGGEVFYLVVPDPLGVHGNVRDAELIRSIVPSVIAHEFQHMIHHNQRIILNEAPNREALWLSEGLAHLAEDLVGEELRRLGRPAEADDYQIGNRQRASLFLTDPPEVSLITAAGQGTLAERGSAWLFLEYLRKQAGSDAVLRSLTETTLTGTVNVESVTGRDWADLFSDWSAALELERQVSVRGALPLREELLFPGFDLMEELDLGGDGFPSMPTLHDSGDFSDQGRLWSSSAAYFVIEAADGGVAVNLSGPDGGPVPRNSRLRLKLVRLF